MDRTPLGDRWAFGRPHQPFVTQRKRRWSGFAATTAIFLLAGAAGAFADTIGTDGDVVAGGNNIDATCVAKTVTSRSVISYAGGQHFAANSNPAITVTPDSPITVSSVPATVSVGAWDANGDSTSFDFSTTVPANTPTGTYKVNVSVTGPREGATTANPTHTASDFFNVNVTCSSTPPTNQPPLVDAGGPYSGAEGSDIDLDGGSASDGDGSIASTTWSILNEAGVSPGTCTLSNASSLTTATIKCTDNGPVIVQLSATDDDGATSNDTATVNVSNADPVASGGSVAVNPWTGTANATFSYTDAGAADTHTASFVWNGTASTTGTASGGTAVDGRTLSPGCHTLTVTGTVTDDDGGTSNEVTLANAQQFPVYSVALLPPFKDGERNIVKAGNVVPVKVSVTNPCTGGPAAVTLYVSHFQGTGDDVDNTSVFVEATSVSAADGSGGQMRLADGFYIYNFSTKPLQTGKDYTVRITAGASWANGGTLVLDAVIQPKK